MYVWSAVQADSKLHYIAQESVVGSKNRWAIDHKDEIFGSKEQQCKDGLKIPKEVGGGSPI